MTPSALAIQDLIHALDQAAAITDDHARCDAVATALREAVQRQPLDESLVQPIESGYGRRLVHRDPAGRYTVVAMAWGAGQGTPIHDHSGLWCVECVYRGQIEVESYRMGEVPGGQFSFDLEKRVTAGVGEAGALIPPFDYHIIRNPFDAPAATLHVYGGEMSACAVFEPRGENYARVVKSLSYTD